MKPLFSGPRRSARMSTVALSMGMLLAFSGCNSSQTQNHTEGHQSPAHELPALDLENAPGNVVLRSTLHASLKHNFAQVRDLILAPVVTNIVEGTISRIDYRLTADGIPMTVYSVTQTTDHFGSTSGEIRVHEDGGYAKVADLREFKKAPSEEESNALDPEGFVDFIFEGAEHPKVGQHVLLFLQPNPNEGVKDDFMPVGSVFGRFVAAADGTFVRPNRGPGWETELRRANLAKHLEPRNAQG